jgi:hypothetical protein
LNSYISNIDQFKGKQQAFNSKALMAVYAHICTTSRASMAVYAHICITRCLRIYNYSVYRGIFCHLMLLLGAYCLPNRMKPAKVDAYKNIPKIYLKD